MIEKASPEKVEVMISNLAQTIKKAQEEAELKGIKQGFEQGLGQGFGHGLEQGREQGFSQGLEQGGKEKQIEIAKNMIECTIPLEIIAKVTGLPLEDITRMYTVIAESK